MAKKVKVSALVLFNRLQGMIKRVLAGDVDVELKDTIAWLAAEMGLADVGIPADLDKLSERHAGEIGGSSIVQDPDWRNTVGAAKGQKNKG